MSQIEFKFEKECNWFQFFQGYQIVITINFISFINIHRFWDYFEHFFRTTECVEQHSQVLEISKNYGLRIFKQKITGFEKNG